MKFIPNLLRKFGLGKTYEKEIELQTLAHVCPDRRKVNKPGICDICAARKYCVNL